MAEPIITHTSQGLSGQSVRAVIDNPGQPQAVADSSFETLKETVRQASDFVLHAIDLTGDAIGQAIDIASDKAFEEAANVGPNIATATPAQLGDTAFSWSGYIQAVGVMCLLLAALWFAVWALRRYGRFNFLPRPGSLPRDSLVMEMQMPLGPRKGLMVVRFMNRRLLLGITEHQISLITEDNSQNARRESDFQNILEDAADSHSSRNSS